MAARATEYATVVVASGSDDVVIVGGGTTVIESVFSALRGLGSPASVATTVKVVAPDALGVPAIVPVAESESPVGSEEIGRAHD